MHCAADSRLSSERGIETDGGAKIFRVPIETYHAIGKEFTKLQAHSIGFAFAGSSRQHIGLSEQLSAAANI